jgi:hypothetical protein
MNHKHALTNIELRMVSGAGLLTGGREHFSIAVNCPRVGATEGVSVVSDSTRVTPNATGFCHARIELP